MRHPLPVAALLVFPLSALACGGSTATSEDAGNADKAALEAAIPIIEQPVARISGYREYLTETDGKDPYAPKRRSDLQKGGAYAAGEIRFAANGARQKIKVSSAATKDFEAALGNVAASCSDAVETSGFEKCTAAIKALDEALEKAATAAKAAGVTQKFPRVAAESVGDEAKKAMAPFLRALKPGTAEQAYFVKRGDAKAPIGDVISACQAAAEETAQVMAAFEKAEEPLRLVAVTHKLSLDSQCRVLDQTETLRKDFEACRKKMKTTDCKVTCSKVRTRIEEGLPAALFASMETDANTLCEK